MQRLHPARRPSAPKKILRKMDGFASTGGGLAGSFAERFAESFKDALLERRMAEADEKLLVARSHNKQKSADSRQNVEEKTSIRREIKRCLEGGSPAADGMGADESGIEAFGFVAHLQRIAVGEVGRNVAVVGERNVGAPFSELDVVAVVFEAMR